MSYDLMVFEPDLAPSKSKIGDWHKNAMEADEGDNSIDPATLKSNRLRAFYDDMRASFPAMNGPDQTKDFDNDRVTGYSFYPEFIYMDFRWSASEAASNAVLNLATKHGLGLFDPQDAGDGIISMGMPNGGSRGKTSWLARLFGQ